MSESAKLLQLILDGNKIPVDPALLANEGNVYLKSAIEDNAKHKFFIQDPKDGSIKGAISAGDTPFGNNALEINYLGASEPNQGTGSALLERIKQEGHNEGKDLVTFPANDESRDWWINKGAKPDSEGSDILRFKAGKYSIPAAGATAAASTLSPDDAKASIDPSDIDSYITNLESKQKPIYQSNAILRSAKDQTSDNIENIKAAFNPDNSLSKRALLGTLGAVGTIGIPETSLLEAASPYMDYANNKFDPNGI